MFVLCCVVTLHCVALCCVCVVLCFVLLGCVVLRCVVFLLCSAVLCLFCCFVFFCFFLCCVVTCCVMAISLFLHGTVARSSTILICRVDTFEQVLGRLTRVESMKSARISSRTSKVPGKSTADNKKVKISPPYVDAWGLGKC